MKTALIPTDFSIASTKILDALLLKQPTQRYRVIFFHAFKLSDSITDLLLLNRRSRDYEIVSEEFYDRLDEYKVKYARQLHFVGIEYFYGSTVAAFKNFMEALSVDVITFDSCYTFNPIHKYSIDPKQLTERVSCEKLALDTSNISTTEKQKANRTQALSLQDTSV
jgi:hypothetical protein